MDKAIIGNKIRIARRHMRLTQDELGFRIGVTKQTLSGWENGRSLPDLLTLCDIAKMCGMTLNDFVEIENDDSFPPTELTDEERFIIEKFRAAQPKIRTVIEILLGAKN